MGSSGRLVERAGGTAPPQPLLFSQEHLYLLAFKRYWALPWKFMIFDNILKSLHLGWKQKQV